ncbi:MAG: hypothetical protein IT350_00725 [Deltaproteobacteria bacterium]|nr:hypothetical protein [Deltaproteobacteria bacterium]
MFGVGEDWYDGRVDIIGYDGAGHIGNRLEDVAFSVYYAPASTTTTTKTKRRQNDRHRPVTAFLTRLNVAERFVSNEVHGSRGDKNRFRTTSAKRTSAKSLEHFTYIRLRSSEKNWFFADLTLFRHLSAALILRIE